MIPVNTVIIPIFPSTNVRSVQADRWLFKVSDEYLEELDKRKLTEKGKVGRLLDRKRQLEKYSAYKEELRYWAQKNNYTLPSGHFCVWFYIPFPQSWRKPKRASMQYAPHQNTPDIDNLVKALFDGLMPRRNRVKGQTGSDDRRIHSYSAFKLWCPPGEEKIIIHEYPQDEFRFVFHPNE